MENLFYNISQVLGITIIHSLWQGLLVWFALRLLFTCAPSMSSVKKHNVGMLAMLTISVWFIYTFITQVQAHVWVDLTAATSPVFLPHFAFPINPVAHAAPSSYYNYVIEGYLPYVSALYFAGLVFNLLRLGLNWQKISLIKRTMIPADEIQLYVDSFCQQLQINKYVSVNISRFVDVPCMIGFFSPIILLPISLTTYLSTEEVKAILLHELSHIKRNDYLLNLVQQFIAILLFFNPFAQLINRIINQERENRCDDLVVQTTAQPLIYAQALLKLEQTRQVSLPLALAATGKKYHLLNRIERIMKTKKPIGNIRHLLVAVVIMAASISSIAWLNPTIKDGKLSIKKAVYPKIVKDLLLTDTTRKKAVKAKKITAYKKINKTKSNYYKHTDETYGLNDAELNRLTAEVNKHAEAIGKYYDSPEFKKQIEMIEQKGKVMEDYYNRPEIKKMQEDQEKLGADFEKNWGSNGETEKLGEQMGESGKKIEKYFSSPEFKQMNEQLEKKYNIPHNRNYVDDSKDENYRKYQDELQSKIPPEVKEQTEQLKKMGEKMRSHYDSPEFREKTKQLRAMGDSLRMSLNGPEMKMQRIEMKKMKEQMRLSQNNPQIKKEQEQLQQATKKLNEYMKSPAFKQRMAEYRKQMEVVLKDKKNFQDLQPIPADSF
jgi:beta-lactamase regulating signal transducer with metallopeptidase domain